MEWECAIERRHGPDEKKYGPQKWFRSKSPLAFFISHNYWGSQRFWYLVLRGICQYVRISDTLLSLLKMIYNSYRDKLTSFLLLEISLFSTEDRIMKCTIAKDLISSQFGSDGVQCHQHCLPFTAQMPKQLENSIPKRLYQQCQHAVSSASSIKNCLLSFSLTLWFPFVSIRKDRMPQGELTSNFVCLS